MKKILTRIRNRLDQGFCQKYMAVNANGLEVDSLDSTAERWCMLGAIEKEIYSDLYLSEYPDTNKVNYNTVRSYIANQIDYSVGIHTWNDSHTKEEVLALLDKVIAEAPQD